MKLKHLRERIHGMSIIELMVAMAVSLIGTIVIFQVYAVNEDVRRSSTAGSDQQTSGLQALILLERELRHAGFGISDSDLYGCKMVTYDNQRVPNFPPAYPLAAVSITANAGNVPDVINVMYGGTNNTAVAVKLAGPMATATDFPVMNYSYGYLAGDMILIGEDVGSACTIREITKVNGQELQTNIGTYTTDPLLSPLGVAVNKAVRWNNPAGTPVVYGAGKVINLGNLDDGTRPPRYNQITVQTGLADPSQNNKLVLQNLWGQVPTFIPIAEQIVQLKAEYGMDDGKNNGTITTSPFIKGDGIVDRYTTEQPSQLVPYVPSPDWMLVKTVRIAVVARSAQPQKATTGTACDATPPFDPSLVNTTYPVRWAYGPDAPKGRPIDVSNSADWRCYKYQVFETTVPLRNVLWSPQ
jgi:type IV pilus assembly protein PilW